VIKIRIYFNDKDHKAILNLKKEIERIHGIENLKYSPEFSNYDIDKDVDKLLQNIPTIPSFIFIDTFGYKGIRKSLIKKVAFRSKL
jgi:three-Cys-motif partner protein